MNTYIPPSKRGTCTACGKAVHVSKTSADEPYCRDCRRAGLAPSRAKHGTSRRYRNGCRCGTCTVAHRQRIASYRVAYLEVRRCAECGETFETRKDRETRFCGLSCANESRRGMVQSGRFRIRDRDRLAIYERDGWKCQICGDLVDREADYQTEWAPTLDHIVPRSEGGSDAPENLRLAHRWCNSVRGDLSFYTDADLRGVA